jgi:hypothetical protein
MYANARAQALCLKQFLANPEACRCWDYHKGLAALTVGG